MHISAVEQAALMQDTNEPQPELPAPTSQSETQEQEPTAVVPTEPEVIEGKVIVLDSSEPTQDHTPPKRTPYWLCIPFTIFCCLVFLAGSFLVPFFTPSATITLIPIERTITTTAAIQVPGRVLPPLALMQSTSVAATGKRHQDAIYAEGDITFYNGQFFRQTIAAGTVLAGSDGVQVVTDQRASIPAANPPIFGQTTVLAHALIAGAQGNIPAYDMDTACCATSVLAKNTQPFTGGAAARDFLVVTREDIQNAASPLQATLSQSEHAALQAQLQPNEQLITPSCLPHVSSDHKPGDEVITVTVTVSETCGGIAYAAHEVDVNATHLITSQTSKTLGANYSLIGDSQITIVHATITHNRQGQAQMLVRVRGTWVYQITPTMQQHLLHLIAGKPQQQARATLLLCPGIAGVHITVEGGNQTLPDDPRNMHIILVYREL